MFGKLIKYDFKSLLKVHIGMYLFMLVESFALLLSELLRKNYPNYVFSTMFGGLLIVMFIITAIIVLIVSNVMCILRYRKNVLKDEGYLTHTLPVESWQIHASKLVVSVVYFYITTVVIYLMASFAMLDIGWGADFYVLINGEMVSEGMTAFMPFLIICLLISPIAFYCQIFMCLCLGYRMSGNKDVMSFVVYIVMNVVTQILSFGLIIIASIAQFGGSIFSPEVLEMEMTEAPVLFMNIVMGGSIVMSILLATVCYLLSVRTLKKKLSLE